MSAPVWPGVEHALAKAAKLLERAEDPVHTSEYAYVLRSAAESWGVLAERANAVGCYGPSAPRSADDGGLVNDEAPVCVGAGETVLGTVGNTTTTVHIEFSPNADDAMVGFLRAALAPPTNDKVLAKLRDLLASGHLDIRTYKHLKALVNGDDPPAGDMAAMLR